MDSLASAALLFLGLIAFNNYKNGTLPDWLKSKFLNAGAPVSSSSPFEVSDASSSDTTSPTTAVRTGLGGGLGALLAPVVGAIGGVFGESRVGHTHQGIDYEVGQGTTVKAARGGRVSYAGAQGTYGLLVVIDHGSGVTTKYAHLSRITVSIGDDVQAGQTIGLSGSTGRSTGPHLHFELRKDGKAIDPTPYLGTAGSVGAALTA